MKKNLIIKCPTCRKSICYDTRNPWRPFCSQTCKDRDVIGWAAEEFRIAGQDADQEELRDNSNREP